MILMYLNVSDLYKMDVDITVGMKRTSWRESCADDDEHRKGEQQTRFRYLCCC